MSNESTNRIGDGVKIINYSGNVSGDTVKRTGDSTCMSGAGCSVNMIGKDANMT